MLDEGLQVGVVPLTTFIHEVCVHMHELEAFSTRSSVHASLGSMAMGIFKQMHG